MSDDILSQMTPVILEEPRAVGHEVEPRGSRNDHEPRGSRNDHEPRGLQSDHEPRGLRNDHEPRGLRSDHEPRGAQNGHESRPQSERAPEPRRNVFGVPVDMAADEPDLDDRPFDPPYGGDEPMRGAAVGMGTATPGEAKHEIMVVGGTAEMRNGVVEILKTIYDPEIPVNIYELGLVYNIVIDETNNVAIRMTLTSPACPVAGSLPPEVEQKVATVEGVAAAKVDIVWEPAWTPDKMSDEAKLQLNLPY